MLLRSSADHSFHVAALDREGGGSHHLSSRYTKTYNRWPGCPQIADRFPMLVSQVRWGEVEGIVLSSALRARVEAILLFFHVLAMMGTGSCTGCAKHVSY